MGRNNVVVATLEITSVTEAMMTETERTFNTSGTCLIPNNLLPITHDRPDFYKNKEIKK